MTYWQYTPYVTPLFVTIVVAAILVVYVWLRRPARGATFVGSLFRSRSVDVVSVARDVLVEETPDAIIVLDRENRIVDVNPAARRILRVAPSTAIGEPAESAFADHFDLQEHLTDVDDAEEDRELTLSVDGRAMHYTLTISTVYDRHGRPIGRLLRFRDSTGQKTLEQQLQRRSDELIALHTTSLDIGRLHDLQTLLEAIVERATRLLDAPAGGLYLCDPERREVTCVVSYNTQRDFTGLVLKYGEGAAGTVAETGEPLIIDDYWTWSRRAVKRNDEHHSAAVLSTPMKWQGDVIGVIHVLHNAGPERFTQADLNLVSLFADQAALAVQKARLLRAERRAVEQAEAQARELRTQKRFLSHLNELTLAALEAHDFDTMLQTLADRLSTLFDADSCIITLWDDETETPFPAAACGELRGPYRSSRRAELGEVTMTAAVLRAGHALVAEDVGTSPSVGSQSTAQHHARALLGLPLIADGEKLGAALIAYDEPHRFTDDEVARGEQASAHVALALAKAHALETARRRAEEAETLREAGATVAVTLDESEAINRILKQLERVVAYDSASVQLLRDGYLEIVGGRGWTEPEEAVVGLRFPIPGDNPNTVAIQERRTYILNDTRGTHASFREDLHSHIRSWLGVPLVVRDTVIGMLTVDSEEPNNFDDNDARLVSAFADHVAIAIENARLFAEIRRLATTDELTGLHNRRFFFELAAREFERRQRREWPICALMIDVDRFKQINDRYGHTIGDEVLRHVAEALSSQIRDVDIVGRYGGEEFVVLLPDTRLSGARRAAERLRAHIDHMPIVTERGTVRVTVSIGIAAATPQIADPQTLVDRADAALYEAKRAGRNAVAVC